MLGSVKLRVIFLLLLGFLVSCDTMYGVKRSARLDYFVDHNCVREALGNVEGVSDVRYQYSEGGRPITITGLQEPDKVHYYHYKTQEINGVLYVQTNYEKESIIWQGYLEILEIPPQAHIDKIRPVMDRIEEKIGPSCGIENFQVIMEEDCSEEIQCPK